MEIDRIIEKWGLSPLEGEGGWFRFLTCFSSKDAGSIYYLVTEDSFSSLHRLSEDELWFFLEGGVARQIIFDEETGKLEERVLDADHRHSLVRAGLWQATKLVDGDYALFSTVMCPHYSDEMYSSPTARLLEANPFLKEYTNAQCPCNRSDIESRQSNC